MILSEGFKPLGFGIEQSALGIENIEVRKFALVVRPACGVVGGVGRGKKSGVDRLGFVIRGGQACVRSDKSGGEVASGRPPLIDRLRRPKPSGQNATLVAIENRQWHRKRRNKPDIVGLFDVPNARSCRHIGDRLGAFEINHR